MKVTRFLISFFSAPLMALALLAGCQGGPDGQAPSASLAQTGPISIARGTRKFSTDFLLFTGSGSWGAEVTNLESILDSHGATYRTVTADDLNTMSIDDMAKYGAFIFPGGYGSSEVAPMSTATRVNIRKAVQERGVGYIGFCAGAFIAVNPAPADGQAADYGLAVVSGPMLPYYFREDYYAKNNISLDAEMVNISFADGTKRDIVWYGGPVTPETGAGVVARYSSGDPFISQIWSGNGFVMLSAGHPTASAATEAGLGLTDADGPDQDIAWKLLDAVRKQQELPKF